MLWQKKVAALFLAAIMLLTLIPVQVFAADEATLTLSTAQGSKGDTVNIGLTMTNNPGIVNLTLLVKYDATAFKLTKVEDTKLLPGSMHSDNLSDPEYCLTWANDTVTSNYTVNGLLVTLSFEILTDVPGSYPITLLSVPDGILDVDMNNIDFTFVNGSVTVKAPKCEHTLNLVAEKPATCTADGTKAYYVCSKCSAKFWDAAGEKPVANDVELVIPATGHVWNEGTVDIEATCAAAGTKIFECTKCTETKSESYSVEPGTHTYINTSWQFRDSDLDSHYQPCDCGAAAGEKKEAHDWKVDEARSTAATCTEDGTTYSICSICNGEKSETIPATGHVWDAGTVTNEATCAAAGTKHFTCTNDGCTATKDAPYSVEPGTHTYTKTKWLSRDGDAENHYQSCDCGEAERKEAHTWDEGKITTPATHENVGVKTYTCTVCNATKTEDVPKLTEHSFGDWSKLDDEYHHRFCVCGTEQKEMHKWDEGTVDKAPTHTEKGVKTFKCTVCEATKAEEIPTLTEHSYDDWSMLDDEYHHRTCVCGTEQKEAHTWDEGTVTTAPTHTEKGVKTFKCTVCEATKTEEIPTLTDHSYGDWSKLDDVYHHRTCVCGDEQKEAHTWDEGVVTTPATHTEKGVKTFKCTVCEATKTEEIPTLTDHSYGEWTKRDNDDEYHYRTCVCGNTQKEAHKWDDGVVTVEPTEDKDGIRTLTCKVCGATKDVVEPYHVHDYDKDFDDVKWSANASYHWKKCACGEISYKSAHIASDWIVDGYPNPVSIGMMHKECVICGYVLAREILPATGVARPTQTTRYTVTASADANGSISHEGKTVVNSGDRITYVITPDDGYEIASVIVNGADVGAVREYTFWNVKSDCTIHATFREIPAAFVNPFIDVAESDAYFDAVMYVYENGLFKGVSETEFAPDTTMTRAMFVTVLGRMAGVNTQLYQKSSFNDVEMGQWYSPYVEWAAHCGIVLGYGDGTFGLNDEITVEQAAVILTRYAAFTGRNTYTLRTLHDFADAADVSDWAVYSMKWIVSSGIYTGENGMLSPKSLAKRSLVAAMLYNYAD